MDVLPSPESLVRGKGMIDADADGAVRDGVAVLDAPKRRIARLADGVELIGEYQGSGFQEPKYLLCQGDGQVIQLPRLLYLVAAAVDGRRDLQQVADWVSVQFGRGIDAEQVSYLLETRFRPAGILAPEPGQGAHGGVPPVMRADPLLSLKWRVGVVPERAVWVIAGFFRSFFLPPVVLAMLGAFVVLDAVVFLRGGLGQVKAGALAIVHQPTLTLLVMAMVLLSGVFHECGHVAACRYGGARPGRMGFGLYLVWPALYSTVTDSYRLSRGGRLRTDLGGVYFNVVSIAVMSLGYLTTGSPWLLIAIVVLHGETLRQFLPFVRLDGYYVLSDLIGVPDLFSRMGPVLRSLFRPRQPHPRMGELKPWVRRVVTLWVLIVVPALAYFLLPFLILAPQVAPVVWDAVLQRGHAAVDSAHAGQLVMTALNVIQMLLLVLPWAGVSLILYSLVGRRLVQLAGWARSRLGSRRVL
jgi:putative peptide zinc metalloprotease protein